MNKPITLEDLQTAIKIIKQEGLELTYDNYYKGMLMEAYNEVLKNE